VLETGRTSLEDCIASCGEGQTTQIPPQEEVAQDYHDSFHLDHNPYSRNFQWLPCMVDISGEHCKYVVITPTPENLTSSISRITSYINNLHPLRYKGLYRLVERVIDAAIPLWNLTLRPLESCHWSNYLRVHYRGSYDAVIEQPEPDVFDPPTEPDSTFNLKEEYAESGLQIIVKLANIHLTPENPSFEGGSWDVEGQSVSFALFIPFIERNLVNTLVKERTHMCDSTILLFQRRH
jgi:hypothetical protein